MAPISIKQSKEFFIFETLSKQSDFNEVYAIFKKYDRDNPQEKIIPAKREKIAIRQMFDVLKKTEKSLMTKEGKPDFNDREVMQTMLRKISDNIYQKCSCPQSEIFMKKAGVSVSKFNIGQMLHQFANHIADEQGIVINKEKRQSSAVTHLYGNVAQGNLNNKTVSDYKPIAKIVRERMMKEQYSSF